ncbi:MAG: tetratricopeptide repeat protein [Chthoniobacterales bacterium]
MKIRKFATITLLVLSSFAANSVAPSKTELEGMYDKAFREFDANNYEQALKDLDAIDARQPDVAESHNLRGVILMRQKDYAKAETALQKALKADPKFWNARFNLAEIPFLQRNWGEARKRFQELLSGNASELQGEATQLIQYKILITYLMEGKENMVNALLAKLELSPDTPAVQYAKAAIALHKKDENGAKDLLTNAEKNFSPQLNKLFAESLYEVGWMEKPAGQTRAALELNTAAERAAQAKAFAQAKFEEAEQALQQRDLTAARKLIEEADAADPNQAPVINLRGEVLLEQGEFDQAENEFKRAAKIDPKFRDAQYNLAQVPFKKKEYAKARDRYEALFGTTTGADKDRAAQLIKFKIYLTLLLEGKDSRAQKMMEQFQFTGDTPALYYAQAAWEFKHENPGKGLDWITSARKIYPPALNGVFADAFFDLGWLKPSSLEASPAPLVADATQAESAPSIEPTPIPSMTLAQNDAAKSSDTLSLAPNSVVPGMEATTSQAEQAPGASTALVASSPSVETPVASTQSPAATQPVIAKTSEPAASTTAPESSPATAPPLVTAASATPATVLAPAKVREWSQPSLSETLERLGDQGLLVGVLVLAAILLLAWVMIPALRRRMQKASAKASTPAPSAPAFDAVEPMGAVQQLVAPTRLAGGPPQVSLQLRASEPALRRAVMPLGKASRTNGNGHGNGQGFAQSGGAAVAPAHEVVETEPYVAPEAGSFEEGVGEPITASAFAPQVTEAPAAPEPQYFAAEPTFAPAPAGWAETAEEPTAAAVEAPSEQAPSWPTFEPAPLAASAETAVVADDAFTSPTAAFAEDNEPVGQGQPVPYLTPASIAESTPAEAGPEAEQQAPAGVAGLALAGIGALRHSVETPSSTPGVVSAEPTAQQPTTPATMPQPTQPTPAPLIRTAPPTPTTGAAPQAPGGMQPSAPQAAGGMHTAVQLTFSFEIASLQLTPTFKMGALQLKPTSRIVTMRLAPSQHPQPAMNLQVTFEIASVQLAGNAIGMVRLTPSQQQRPSITSSPAFNIAGMQLVSGAESAPVQLTPSQQGQASVHVTAGFQIATVEFSPSFEIASIILNSTSRNVSVQLPGAGPTAVEGAPVFEVANVQLAGNGEIGMMQLNPPGAAAKRA